MSLSGTPNHQSGIKLRHADLQRFGELVNELNKGGVPR